MPTHRFPPVLLPRSIVETTDKYLSISREEGVEVVVYWSGKKEASGLVVRKVWFPAQTSSPRSFAVGQDALFELNFGLYRLGHELVGQVHTHPSIAFHSETDDENAVSLQSGAISAVVPSFGLYSVSDLDHTLFFERRSHSWVELSSANLAARVKFINP